MKVSCPNCAVSFPLELGFVELDGKKLAAVFAELEPPLGKAVLDYLGLFKPAKSGLRLSRALVIAQEVSAMARAGTVEWDGNRRDCIPAFWVECIEQMLARRAELSLPLSNNNYLRKIVFAHADRAEARAEIQREESRRRGDRNGQTMRRLDYAERAARIRADVQLGLHTQADADRKLAALDQEFGRGR
ncbi:MAG TPA: hypothetical protein PKZ76_03480 [Xanthomonadaceae bacterium]|nr:hypothetical protein [Xanthomonadaceae bacterium]